MWGKLLNQKRKKVKNKWINKNNNNNNNNNNNAPVIIVIIIIIVIVVIKMKWREKAKEKEIKKVIKIISGSNNIKNILALLNNENEKL